MYPIADQYGKDKFADILRHVENENKRLTYTDYLPDLKCSDRFAEKTANVLLGFLALVAAIVTR